MVFTTAVSFAGSGLLLLYYAGVASVLTQQGVIKPGETPLGGISGGAVVAVQTCAGVPFEQQFMSLKLVWAYCQVTFPGDPFCGGQGGPLLRQAIYQNIRTYGAPDALRRCHDTLLVGLSELQPLDTILKPVPWAFNKPTTVEELADAAAVSSFLPCSMASMSFATFRGRPVIDGGYSSGFNHICNPDAKVCIRVSAFAVGPNNPTGLPANCPQLGMTSLQPAPKGKPSGPITQKLPARAQWKLPDTCEYDPETGAFLSPKLPALVSPGMPDIYPGFPYNPLKRDPCEWQSLFLNVTAMTPDNIMFTYDQGADDATAWLAANPMIVAAKKHKD